MTTPTEAPKYQVAIPAHRLRQPPDVSAVTAIDPNATCLIRGAFTEAEFARICDGNIRNFLSLECYGPDDWTIHVGPEEALVGDNSRSPQERCIIAWLNSHRPGWDPGAIEPSRLARYGDDITLPVLYFLMDFYNLLADPWQHKDDDFFLQQMAEAGIGYEDIAILPEARNAGG